MTFTDRTDPRAGTSRTRRGLGAAALLATAVLAGCGGSVGPSDAPAGTSGGTADAAAPSVAPAELQRTADAAFGGKGVDVGTLPPLVKDTLARATAKLTPAQTSKAYECWKATSCTIGDGKLTVAYADAFGGNTWRQFTKMSVILGALAHPEVGRFVYTDAKFDLATYQANLRTVVAQGADVVVTNDEFGPAAYPALTAAQKQGAKVATFIGSMDDAPAAAYTTRVQYDLCTVGKDMARITQEATKAKGPVAFLEGLAGNPQDARTRECVQQAGVPVAFKDATEYTPAGTQKAASALIASGKPVKAILASYANTVPSIVDAYAKARKEVPAIITLTQSNRTACQREEKPYPLYFTSSLNWSTRIAVDAGVQAATGGQAPKAVQIPLPIVQAGKADCDPSKPAEYPGETLVPDALVDQMLASR